MVEGRSSTDRIPEESIPINKPRDDETRGVCQQQASTGVVPCLTAP